jgi:hypothetical protein
LEFDLLREGFFYPIERLYLVEEIIPSDDRSKEPKLQPIKPSRENRPFGTKKCRSRTRGWGSAN